MCGHLAGCQLTGGVEEGGTVLLGRIMSLLFMYLWSLLMGGSVWWAAQGGCQYGGHHMKLSLFWWVSPIGCPWNNKTVQNGSRQTRKRCCIAANGAGSSKLMWKCKGITSLRSPAKIAALLCRLPSKQSTVFGFLSHFICSFFIFPFHFPFLNLTDQHTVHYKILGSTVTCRKRHTITCLKIFLSAVYMYCDLVSSHTSAELRIYWIYEPNMWFKISLFFVFATTAILGNPMRCQHSHCGKAAHSNQGQRRDRS